MDEIRASAGAITIRQLARETAAVIEWVREREKPMLITRNGVPVALIQPLEFESWVPPARATTLPSFEAPDIDWEELDLDERERLVLPAIGERFTIEEIIGTGLSPSQAALSCAHLEVKRLAARTIMGYRLTALGRRVQRALKDEGAEEPPPSFPTE